MAVVSHLILLCGIGLMIWWVNDVTKRRKDNPRNLPLPPGPKGYPIIGTLLDHPFYKPWLTYDKWFKIYGDMIYFELLGQPFLILGDLQRVYDLFERRSSNYSDRPHSTMLTDLMGPDYLLPIIPYGDWWRRHRRTFHHNFHPNVVNKYQPVQLSATRNLLRRLLKTPDNFMYHIRHSFSMTIIKVTYGLDIQEENDPAVYNAEIAVGAFAEAGHQGSFLVDIFPIMKYIPSWFPGAGWKKKAEYWRYINDLFVNGPWDTVKEQMKKGTAAPSIAANLIAGLPSESSPDRHDEEIVARNVCAVAFAGGADTTVSTVQSFFMAMCLYPEVQKKAQAELDSVLRGRLPEVDDRPNLPYINALMKESTRWQQVVPLPFAHMSSEADEYNGYYIPKGTIVMGNSWTILHDPEIFPDPLTYNPDRYLKDGIINPAIRDPSVASFGFGRRICPGRHFSENSLYLIVSHVLAVFDIRPGLDENGKEVKIIPEMTSGLLSYPKPFACRITPRSKEARELIENSGLLG